MAYKTLLTTLTDPDLAPDVLAQAQSLAKVLDAHLDVLCLGVDRTQAGYYYAGANAAILQETISRATDEAADLAARAKTQLKAFEGRWGIDHGVAQIVDIGRHVAGRARFSDLTVQPKPYGDQASVEQEAIIEGALFDGQCPVLVLPQTARITELPKRIVLAWNESNEALRATRAALPFLMAADMVHVVVVDPPRHGPQRSDPGGMISHFLARHGVRAEIDVLSKTLPRVSDILLRHCADIDADMVVMGAYGHSRFREAILGGATRNMLEQATLPVLMAH